MLTKKQFAECVLAEFYQDERITYFNHDLKGAWKDKYALRSTCVGKAASFLGFIQDKEISDYLDARGGTFKQYINMTTKKFEFLTMEDMFSLLPENL